MHIKTNPKSEIQNPKHYFHWKITGFFFLVCGLWSVVCGSWALAGGPFTVNDEGTAATWDASDASPITVHPESGTCATFSNSEMIDKIDENISVWSDIAGINLSFAIDEGEVGSVDGDNYEDFIVDSSADPGLNDGLNPILFDDDGEMTDDIFGECNRFAVLGFAGPDGFLSNFSEIVDAQGVFNCLCLSGNDNGPCVVTSGCTGETGVDAGDVIVFSEDDLNFTMTHEVGHMLNLDHTQVNAAVADAGCSATAGDCDDIPTMYPISEDAADQITPQRDDEVALLTLYGGSSLADDFCTVTGRLVDVDGASLRCADVQAETSDTTDAIAMVSGAFASADDTNGDGFTDGDGECIEDCGDFALRGLDPSKSYTITVKPIDSSFVDGSSVGPCGNGQLTGVNEEVIATSVNCGAGETEALGTVETTSTGGVTEGGGDDDDGSTSVGCRLGAGGSSPLPLVTLLATVLFSLVAWRCTKFS